MRRLRVGVFVNGECVAVLDMKDILSWENHEHNVGSSLVLPVLDIQQRQRYATMVHSANGCDFGYKKYRS